MLGISRVQFIGHVHILWASFQQYAQDGDLKNYRENTLALCAEFEGDSDMFIAALVVAGIIEFDGDKPMVRHWPQISMGHMLPARAEWNALRKKIAPIVKERDGNRCIHCGTDKRLTVDHIYPISKGGDNDMDNLATLCGPCNSRKGARI